MGTSEALESVSRIAESVLSLIEQALPVHIVSHYDADGLASASIIGKALLRLNVPFHVHIVEQIDATFIDNLAKLRDGFIIFLDMGSGQKSLLEKCDKSRVIIDHHQPSGERSSLELNPHFFGLDGSYAACSATLSFLVAVAMNEGNYDLAPLAIAGAIGDRQYRGPKKSLTSLNQLVVEEAKKKALVEESVGLRLYGFPYLPIVKSLQYTTDPLIPFLSNDEGACVKFLKSININPVKENGWRTFNDLSKEEIARLATELVKHMLNYGCEYKEAEDLFGTVYRLVSSGFKGTQIVYAHELAYLLNACGRLGRHGLAIAMCLGDPLSVLKEVQEVHAEYRQTVAKCLDWLRSADVKQLEFIQVVNGLDVIPNRLAGVVASMSISLGICNPNKPVLLMTKSPVSGNIKCSARISQLTSGKAKLDLGFALREAAEHVGGVGGGHSVAAGALIPEKELERFIRGVNDVIKRQMNGVSIEG